MQKNNVGRMTRTIDPTSAGVGGLVGSTIAVAPAANGNVSELPSP
jgi:hypothetical protein